MNTRGRNLVEISSQVCASYGKTAARLVRGLVVERAASPLLSAQAPDWPGKSEDTCFNFRSYVIAHLITNNIIIGCSSRCERKCHRHRDVSAHSSQVIIMGFTWLYVHMCYDYDVLSKILLLIYNFITVTHYYHFVVFIR